MFTYWLNGRWFLQIDRDRHDSWDLIRYILYSLDLILYLKCGGHSGWVGGGGVMFFSHFMLFTTILEKNNSGNTKINRRWFLQIVDRDSWNLYPLYPLFPCSDFVSQMWGSQWFGGGGGVMFFSHFMLFATFIVFRKTILSHFMFGGGGGGVIFF